MTYREMSEVTRIQYLRSDITVPPSVYEAAARIYAAYLQTGQGETDAKALMHKAVSEAIELALMTERICAGTGTVKGGLD